MYELALFILDLAQNSLSADADLIKIWLIEDSESLSIVVADNGCGMSPEMCQNALDPFMTTKSRKKKIGLGLPLFKDLVEMCDGTFKIQSRPKIGSVIYGSYSLHHLDQPPLGKMSDTIFALVAGNPSVNFRYTHTRESQTKVFDTRPVKKVLGENAENLWQSSEVLEWIENAIIETDLTV